MLSVKKYLPYAQMGHLRRFSTIAHGALMRQRTLLGARKLSNAVELTLGPGGRTTVIDPFEAANFNALSAYPKPIITKDGATVASHVNLLRDRLENIGA